MSLAYLGHPGSPPFCDTPEVGLIAGTHVWDELHTLVSAAAHRRAAIAYAGRHAAELMPLSSGDIVVIDGSDDALKAGSTHPKAVAAWLSAGAQVWSLRDLHAKLMLLEDAAGAMTAVIGSANASAHSNNDLLEAVVVIDEPAVCEAVSEQLDLWTGLAQHVGDRWLEKARTLYREPRTPHHHAGTLRFRADPTAPLWVGKGEPLDDHGSPAARAAYEQVVSRYDRVGEVVWWQLNRGDDDLVLAGQNVVLVNNPSGRNKPVGQASARAPAKIVRVVPGRGRHLPVAILVRQLGLATLRFSQVRQAVEQSGEQLDWSRPLDRKAAAPVYQLWPQAAPAAEDGKRA